MKAARVVVLTVAIAAGGMAALLAGRFEKFPASRTEAKLDTVAILASKADIGPRDPVDVILSRRDRAAEKAAGAEIHSRKIILKNIGVPATDPAIEEKNGQRIAVGKTAMLELAPSQAETLALARSLGTLSLAPRSVIDANATATDTDSDQPGMRRGSVNVIRFGVSTMTTPK